MAKFYKIIMRQSYWAKSKEATGFMQSGQLLNVGVLRSKKDEQPRREGNSNTSMKNRAISGRETKCNKWIDFKHFIYPAHFHPTQVAHFDRLIHSTSVRLQDQIFLQIRFSKLFPFLIRLSCNGRLALFNTNSVEKLHLQRKSNSQLNF